MTTHKKCSCGRCFTKDEWLALPIVGICQLDDGVFSDMRTCPEPCGSSGVGPLLTVADDWTELSGLLAEAMKMPRPRVDDDLLNHARLVGEYEKLLRSVCP